MFHSFSLCACREVSPPPDPLGDHTRLRNTDNPHQTRSFTFVSTTILTVFFIIKDRKTPTQTNVPATNQPASNHPVAYEPAPHYGQEEKAVADHNTSETPAYTATDAGGGYNNSSNAGYYGNNPAANEMPAAPPAAQHPQ